MSKVFIFRFIFFPMHYYLFYLIVLWILYAIILVLLADSVHKQTKRIIDEMKKREN